MIFDLDGPVSPDPGEPDPVATSPREPGERWHVTDHPDWPALRDSFCSCGNPDCEDADPAVTVAEGFDIDPEDRSTIVLRGPVGLREITPKPEYL